MRVFGGAIKTSNEVKRVNLKGSLKQRGNNRSSSEDQKSGFDNDPNDTNNGNRQGETNSRQL